MNIRFNVTGAERKRLVAAIGEALSVVPVYMKAPSFAYTVRGFVIDKDGTLCPDGESDGASMHGLLAVLAERGFTSEDSVDMADPDAEASAENIPATNTSTEEVSAGDTLSGEAVPAADDPAEDSRMYETSAGSDPYRMSIEVPLDGFTSTALDNLNKLTASKAALIRKAIGASDLPIERETDRLCFPWFSPDSSPEETDAYIQFVTALCETAKKQQRVTAKEKHADSEKFAFRCFLLRLGFIGNEYAVARKILLRNLSGSASFKNGDGKRRERGHDVLQAANAADSGAESSAAASVSMDETAAHGAAPRGVDGDTATHALAEALADAELIYNVNMSFMGGDGGNE